jgi:uncharacterized Tic20 family protein
MESIAVHLPMICLLVTGILVTAILLREDMNFGIGKTGATLVVGGAGVAIAAGSATEIGVLVLTGFIWVLLAILAFCLEVFASQ